MTESEIMKRIQIFASKIGLRLWRNNVAQTWSGKVQHFRSQDRITVYPGDIVIRRPRPIHCGLCPGSSDLIGLKPTVIDETHIGKRVGIFTAIEVKSPKGQTNEIQDNFIRTIEELGGIARVARSTEDLEDLSGDTTVL